MGGHPSSSCKKGVQERKEEVDLRSMVASVEDNPWLRGGGVHKVLLSDGLRAQGKAPCLTLRILVVGLSPHVVSSQASQLARCKSTQLKGPALQLAQE